jgi:hypothetical protein
MLREHILSFLVPSAQRTYSFLPCSQPCTSSEVRHVRTKQLSARQEESLHLTLNHVFNSLSLDLRFPSPQNCEKINFCWLNHTVCGILLRQHELTNTTSISLWHCTSKIYFCFTFVSKIQQTQLPPSNNFDFSYPPNKGFYSETDISFILSNYSVFLL